MRDISKRRPALTPLFLRATLIVLVSASPIARARYSAGQDTSPSQSGTPAKRRQPTPFEERTFMRSPGGLARLASVAGDYVYVVLRESVVDPKLAFLASASPLILVGTLESAGQSWLSTNGNRIFTDYVFRPDLVIKGSVSGDITVSMDGGKVAFPNGTTATLSTIEWESLKVEDRYLLFLRTSSDGRIRPSMSFFGIIDVSVQMGTVDPLASREGGARGSVSAPDALPHAIVRELQGMAPAAVIARVLQIVAAGAQ